MEPAAIMGTEVCHEHRLDSVEGAGIESKVNDLQGRAGLRLLLSQQFGCDGKDR